MNEPRRPSFVGKHRQHQTSRSGRFVPTGKSAYLYHFKSAGARAEAVKTCDLPLHNAVAVTVAMQQGKVSSALLVRVPIHQTNYSTDPVARTPRQARTISLVSGKKRTLTEFVAFIIDIAQIAKAGFRNPSNKSGHRRGPLTLVEKAAIAAGQMTPPESHEYSKRGLRKLEADAAMKAEIAKEREPGFRLPDK